MLQTGLLWLGGIFGTLESLRDIKRKAVPVGELFIMAGVTVLGVTAAICKAQGPVPVMRFLGLLPGIFLLLISLIWKEGVGRADGELVCIFGGIMGWPDIGKVLCIAFFLLFLYALPCLAFGKLKRKDTIAFYPFLTIGYLAVLLISNL